MKKIFALFTAIYFAVSISHAQGVAIKAGETIPDISFSLRLKDSVFIKRFSDFNGKILLLDFWAVHCVDCIASMPKLLSLQEEFNDKIQIILVTSNSNEEIKLLKAKLKKNPSASRFIAAGDELPQVTGDSLLQNLFPHTGVPTHVWIDENLELLSVAYGSSTNRKTIEQLIAGQNVLFDEQQQHLINVKNPLSWVIENKSYQPALLHYSLFMPHIEYGAGGTCTQEFLTDSSGKFINGVSMTNCSILQLYQFAYQGSIDLQPVVPFNRIILETKRNEDLYFSAKEDDVYAWNKKNTFCYGFKTCRTDTVSILQTMRTDLDRYLGLESTIEKRKVNCYVLKETDKSLIKTNGGKVVRERYFNHEQLFIKLQNVSLKVLFNELNSIVYVTDPFYLFINETSTTGNIDIDIPAEQLKKVKSIDELIKFLQPYGLTIQLVIKTMPMLVIREKK